MTPFAHIGTHLPKFSSYLQYPKAGKCLRAMIEGKNKGKIFVEFFKKAIPLMANQLNEDEAMGKLLKKAITKKIVKKLPKETYKKFEKVISKSLDKLEKMAGKEAEKARRAFEEAARKHEAEMKARQAAIDAALKASKQQAGQPPKEIPILNEIMKNSYYRENEHAAAFQSFAQLHQTFIGEKELNPFLASLQLTNPGASKQLKDAILNQFKVKIAPQEVNSVLKKLTVLLHVDKMESRGITDAPSLKYLAKLWDFLQFCRN